VHWALAGRPHSTAGDPRFVKRDYGVFWLRPDSPAIGKGTPEYAQAMDMGIRDLNAALSLPVVHPPETVDQYSSAGAMLEAVVIENASGRRLSSFFRQYISGPIGAESVRLWDAYGAAGYAFMQTRDFARFGCVVLRNGAWNNGSGLQQVVRADLIAKCTHWPTFLMDVTDGPGNNSQWLTTDDPPSHFLHTWHGWWVNRSPDWPSSRRAVWPFVPKDAFWMSGYGKDICVVIPSLDMIIFTLLKDWPFAAWTDFILKQVQVGSIGIAGATSDSVPQPKEPIYNGRAYARRNQLLIDLRRFGQPVIDEEPGYDTAGTASAWNSQTPERMRRTFWTAATAGAYTIWGSMSVYVTGDPLPKMKGSATPPYLRVLHDVMTALPYKEMEPINEAVTRAEVVLDGEPWRTNYALGKPGEAYLVYSLGGGTGKITLAPGRYTASRVDPRDGTQREMGTAAGGAAGFSLPPGDWVLVYRRTAASDRNAPSGSQWRSLPLITENKIDYPWPKERKR
jgi:CubicO group peptidase (beta-lactamase class C family)